VTPSSFTYTPYIWTGYAVSTPVYSPVALSSVAVATSDYFSSSVVLPSSYVVVPVSVLHCSDAAFLQ